MLSIMLRMDVLQIWNNMRVSIPENFRFWVNYTVFHTHKLYKTMIREQEWQIDKNNSEKKGKERGMCLAELFLVLAHKCITLTELFSDWELNQHSKKNTYESQVSAHSSPYRAGCQRQTWGTKEKCVLKEYHSETRTVLHTICTFMAFVTQKMAHERAHFSTTV